MAVVSSLFATRYFTDFVKPLDSHHAFATIMPQLLSVAKQSLVPYPSPPATKKSRVSCNALCSSAAKDDAEINPKSAKTLKPIRNIIKTHFQYLLQSEQRMRVLSEHFVNHNFFLCIAANINIHVTLHFKNWFLSTLSKYRV